MQRATQRPSSPASPPVPAPGASTTRRAFLGTTALAGAALTFGGAPAQARVERTSDFVYEFQLSEAEWRDRLSKYEYEIMRNNGTEWAKSSNLWDDYREGEFHCKGCDLHLYSSEWRVELDKGWVFFSHAQPTAVMMDIDKAANYSMTDNATERTLIEAHCRRCGSHLGHILTVDRMLVHCINGHALKFEATTA